MLLATICIGCMTNLAVCGSAADCSRVTFQLWWRFCCWVGCTFDRLTRSVWVSVEHSIMVTLVQ